MPGYVKDTHTHTGDVQDTSWTHPEQIRDPYKRHTRDTNARDIHEKRMKRIREGEEKGEVMRRVEQGGEERGREGKHGREVKGTEDDGK